ncbi:hypothetical protein Sa4125_34300 [Aureimonas sp. SA4125]|uniref:hypothetical protein n=1 Tax=Aureimonas sp. SA4125 TaxID=2826993 RepID=UPI001CC3977F|nr:hypothetical protein [Aureimonas sp. SA4125]BDA85888.1 hypothetical protein Sa4125_34300 [Aureimonas sp. SA4125]
MLLALVTKIFAGEAGVFLARLKRIAGLYVLMAICLSMLVIFLMIALFTWASQHFGTLPTALGFCGGSLVLVLLTFVMIMMAKRRPSTRADDRLQRDIASIASVTALSNAPQIFRAIRHNRSLIAFPIAAGGLYGLYRLIAGSRRRGS